FADRITLRDWQWKKTGDAGVGVIAQEVQEYAPHLVTMGDSLSVDKAGLALEAVVDLAARVRQLEKVIHGSTNGRTRTQLPRARATGR
ncbi:tail fiber domain-containing protein, partial [Klebsiella pneumoniae]|nr:tail fiber domain-containing protein [Klebsiella pneumoniae]